MAMEIERKFLVDNDKLVLPSYYKKIKQGYIPRGNSTTVRIRLSNDDAFLTIKGASIDFISRSEFEYKIPFNDANEILDTLCSESFIEKKRFEIFYEGKKWEVDIFEGLNRGLVVAEIELESVDEIFKLPEWVSTEVTKDKKYSNSNLISNPFVNW